MVNRSHICLLAYPASFAARGPPARIQVFRPVNRLPRRDWRCRPALRIPEGARCDCWDGHRHRENHLGDKCKPIWFRGQCLPPAPDPSPVWRGIGRESVTPVTLRSNHNDAAWWRGCLAACGARVGTGREDSRDARADRLDRLDSAAAGDDHSHLPAHEICHQSWYSVIVVLGLAVFDRDVAASTKPASLRPWRNAATIGAYPLGVSLLSHPTNGMAGCCARIAKVPGGGRS
jgi:hypothetical protein